MRPISRFLLGLVLLMSVITAFAQGGGGGQGRRGGGGGGITGLLRRPDVQADLQLTDEQKTKLTDLRTQMRQQFQNNSGTPPDPAEMRQRQEAYQKAVEAILTPDQNKRLHQIQVQTMGEESATLPEVQAAIGLSDEQKSQLKELQATHDAANTSVRDKQRSGEIDRAAAQQARDTNTKVFREGIHKILTQAQLDKIKELGGKPFVADTGGGGGR